MNNLKEIVSKLDLQYILEDKNYKFFKNGDYNLNIIGIRADKSNKITNLFDDILVIDYKNSKGRRKVYYNITTEPGLYYMRKKLLSPKGCAILVPGQYSGCWSIGLHNGKYKALVQTKPVKVFRDNNKDDVYDMMPDTIESGVFGINIHRSNPRTESTLINNWSAGCQVFAKANEYNSFMALCEEQAKRYGNSFTYTLIEEKDLNL